MSRLFLMLAAFGLTAVTTLAPASAQMDGQYPVCVRGDGMQDCRYNTMQQCMQFVAGIGGDCIYNPAYANPSAAPGPNLFQRMMSANGTDAGTDQPNQPIPMPPPPRW